MKFAKVLEFSLDLPLRVLLRLPTYLVRRDPSLWVFGSWAGTRFADNAKSAFLYSHERQEVRCVWISRRSDIVSSLRGQGFEAYRRLSPLGIWTALRAGAFIFDSSPNDINYGASRGARLVNLWHGIPLKRILLDKKAVGPLPRTFEFFNVLLRHIRHPWMYGGYDLVSATSEPLKPLLASAFGVSAARVQVVGLPRNDQLFSTEQTTDSGLDSTWAQVAGGGTRTLLMMPTFRNGRPSLQWSEPEQRSLDDLLGRHGCRLLLKLHPVDASKDLLIENLKHISILPTRLDMYPHLKQVDCLITDYSSIYFDFLMLNKPIIFYCWDLEAYLRDDRGMYFEYGAVTPGAKVRNFPELLEAIRAFGIQQNDPFQFERANVRDRFHKFVDGQSAERTFQAIRALFEQTRK